jgi:hypothetical protein
MDRRLSPESLIEYHFGTLEGPARTAVEEALLESEESLRAYLRLKRELDGAYASDEVPGPAAKTRLRAAIAAEVGGRQPGLREPAGPGAWSGLLGVFWRPIPLYQTLAVAAVAAVLVGILGLPRIAGTAGNPRPGDTGGGPAESAGRPSSPGPKVDFTGPRPVGLDVL